MSMSRNGVSKKTQSQLSHIVVIALFTFLATLIAASTALGSPPPHGSFYGNLSLKEVGSGNGNQRSFILTLPSRTRLSTKQVKVFENGVGINKPRISALDQSSSGVM